MSNLSEKVLKLLFESSNEGEKKLKERIIKLIYESQNEYEEKLKEKILNIISSSDIEEEINFQETIPELSWFHSLNEQKIQRLVEKDKKERTYHTQLVFNACQKNKPDELIIFLVEKGFPCAVWETPAMVRHGRLELLKYYYKNITKGEWNMYCYSEAIKTGRNDILLYLLENTVVNNKLYYPYLFVSKAVEECFALNAVESLKLFFQFFEDQVKSCAEKLFDNHILTAKLSGHALLWLWENGIRWNQRQAEQSNNLLMKKF